MYVIFFYDRLYGIYFSAGKVCKNETATNVATASLLGELSIPDAKGGTRQSSRISADDFSIFIRSYFGFGHLFASCSSTFYIISVQKKGKKQDAKLGLFFFPFGSMPVHFFFCVVFPSVWI